MFAKVLKLPARSRDEAEKPFWISYADLMTALMVLFLVTMSVALLAVTKTVTEQERQKAAHDRAVEELLDEIEVVAREFEGVRVDRNRRVIEFNKRARFDTNVHELKPEQARLLREFVPRLLDVASRETGRKILKRVVIEGFADQSGTYLYNLNLSLLRSQSVLCSLFSPPFPDELPLSEKQLTEVRDLFLVGGYSFNDARRTAEESRRVEFRLELYGVSEERLVLPSAPAGNFGRCPPR
jgi:outer membrane protein OmpA-like peptidoglycan-associated protein